VSAVPLQPVLRPVVDYNRCDGKGVCTQVCPWSVFEVQLLTATQCGPLSLSGKLRRLLNGGRQAAVARPDDCHACGACVRECPEEAIRLA